MRTLKLACAFLCGLSLFSAIEGIRAIYFAPAGGATMKHGVIGTMGSAVLAVFWAFALYGVYKKAPLAWKLGWAVIVVGLLAFLTKGLSAMSKVPASDHPWVASAAVVIGGFAVAIYWSLWWNRQRSYFQGSDSRRNKN